MSKVKRGTILGQTVVVYYQYEIGGKVATSCGLKNWRLFRKLYLDEKGSYIKAYGQKVYVK